MIGERHLRRFIRAILLSESSLATVSDITRFKPQLEEWVEILVDEMADTFPRMKEIEDKLKKTKSKIINHVIWGKKKLAYPIQNHKYGTYVMAHYN